MGAVVNTTTPIKSFGGGTLPNPRQQSVPRDAPWTLFHALEASRLLSEEQLDRLRELLPECDEGMLADLVVEVGWLTPYQLKRVRAGKGAGLVVGQYRILEELGAGGFGTVYKAVHAIMNRPAAIKFLSPQWCSNEDVRSVFLREVIATTRLSHPNIATAYDANETDGSLWFAMEFVDGPTLERFVWAEGPLPIPLACAIAYQVAQALQYAHERGMVHRDIKPANLVLPGARSGLKGLADRPGPGVAGGPIPGQSSQVLVKVVDFGLARLRPTTSYQPVSICEQGGMLGTPDFVAPEQARNGHEADIRSDLYSLGCTLYYALTGQVPFNARTSTEALIMHQLEDEVPLSTLRPETPPSVAAIVKRLMAKRPENRFQTPAELMEALVITLLMPGGGGVFPRPAPLCREEDVSSSLGVPPSAAEQPRVGDAVAPRVGEGGRGVTTDEAGAGSPSPGEEAGSPEAQFQVVTHWREWVEVVEAVLGGVPPALDEAEYKALYKDLLEGLSSQSGVSDRQGELYARMKALIEPWVRLQALVKLEPNLRAGLLGSCEEIDKELCPRPSASLATWAFTFGMLAAVALAAAYAAGLRW